MKRWIGLALTALIAAVAASSAHGTARATATSQGIKCGSQMKIAIVTPLTGGAAFLGQEQLTWAKLAVKLIAPKLHLKVQLLQGDTPVEQGATPAQTLAQKYVADSKVLGIIGPSTSGAVAASTQTYFQAHMAHISPSATRAGRVAAPPRALPAALPAPPANRARRRPSRAAPPRPSRARRATAPRAA